MTTTVIEIHESILGDFAHREDAQALASALIAVGWPAVYAETPAAVWHFAHLAEYRRFGRDWEAAVDALGRGGALRVTWDCDCDERQEHPCPHGDDVRPTVAVQDLAGEE